MQDIFRKTLNIETRWASFENPGGVKGAGGKENQGAKGHAFDSVAPGETKVLLDVQGCGTVHRIWLTLRERLPTELRAFRLDMYWDGESKTAVSVPIGDFFCAGLGLVPFENELFASPEGQSFITTMPMPFRTAARITLTNESDEAIPYLFYDVNYTLTDQHTEDVLYFHAHWRRENPTTLGQDFEILPRVHGNGRFLGTSISVITDPVYAGSWWGEGEVKLFLDGDQEHPTCVGTGTEDYIGTGWGQGTFYQRHQGSLIANNDKGWFSFYRLHIPDPIYFQQDCRVTIQQIGSTNQLNLSKIESNGARLKPISFDGGSREQYLNLLEDNDAWDDSKIEPSDWCNFYRQDDWAAAAYFYLDKPTNNLPALAPVSTRNADLAEKEPPKAALAEPLLQSLYVPGSLRTKPNGFAFTLQNNIETSPLVAFKRLFINGDQINPSQIVLVTMHGVERRISGISSSAPLLFPVNTTLRVQVNGRILPPGHHTVQAQFMLQDIPGIIEVEMTDFITTDD